MHIQPGDYMIWYGSETKDGYIGFRRMTDDSVLKTIKAHKDEKLHTEFLKTDSDFFCFANVIATTHNMIMEQVGPDDQSDYPALFSLCAVRFVARDTKQ